MASVLNPPVVLKQYQCHERGGITINVFRDDVLVGGTKQRALAEFIRQTNYDEYVYAGPCCGMAQVALSYACKLLNKKCHIFVGAEKPGLIHQLTRTALKHNAKAEVILKPCPLKIVEEKAAEYVARNPLKIYQMPFGMENELYKKCMTEALRECLQSFHKRFSPPKRLWIVGGSATLLSVFAQIWPETHFLVVQVGKKIWPDQLGMEKNGTKRFESTLFIAPEAFYENRRIDPPYHSNVNYDAKIWQFVQQHGEEGDYVWNVA